MVSLKEELEKRIQYAEDQLNKLDNLIEVAKMADMDVSEFEGKALELREEIDKWKHAIESLAV